MFDVNALKAVAGQKLGLATLLAKKYSPEVLTVVGVVGVIASVVMVAKATTKLEPVLDKHEEEVDAAKSLRADGVTTEEQYKLDLTRIYTKRTIDVVRLYLPSGTLLVASLGCMVGAAGILKKRNVALAAAYKVVESQLEKARQHMPIEGVEREDTGEEVVDPGTGVVAVRSKTDPNRYSPYARIFDEGNVNYNGYNPYGNLSFLRGQQNYANDRLKTRGWLLLNEVYRDLGFQETKEGAIVGWSLKKGDDFVDFGMYDPDSPAAADFVNGHEKNVILDFNVAGVIFEDIGLKDLVKKPKQ